MHNRIQGGSLQVHPTRLCNLACRHCYSDSSPQQRGALRPELISQVIEDAAAIGFDVISLSGGEPLIYDGLGEILQTARTLGCKVNFVSNGILIAGRHYRRHAGSFSVVALSLDGLAPRHNAIRGSDKSFEQVRRAARILRDDGQLFGLIHTMTSESLDEIETLCELAAEWGAGLIQLHPFEPAGRGIGVVGMTPLSAHERVVAYVLAAATQSLYPQLRVQLDLVHRDIARRAPEVLLAQPMAEPAPLNELVLQDDGTIVPLTYGLGSHWAVTDIRRQCLAEAWPQYLAAQWPELRRRIRLAALEVARGRHGDVAAWHPVLRDVASRMSTSAPLRKELVAA